MDQLRVYLEGQVSRLEAGCIQNISLKSDEIKRLNERINLLEKDKKKCDTKLEKSERRCMTLEHCILQLETKLKTVTKDYGG